MSFLSNTVFASAFLIEGVSFTTQRFSHGGEMAAQAGVCDLAIFVPLFEFFQRDFFPIQETTLNVTAYRGRCFENGISVSSGSWMKLLKFMTLGF
jgi:hypothetical protein